MEHHPNTSPSLKTLPSPSRTIPQVNPSIAKAAAHDIHVSKEKHLQEAASVAHWICLGPTKTHVHWERLVILTNQVDGSILFFLQKTHTSCTSGKGAWQERAGDLLNDEYYTSPKDKGKFFDKCVVTAIVNKDWYLANKGSSACGSSSRKSKKKKK